MSEKIYYSANNNSFYFESLLNRYSDAPPDLIIVSEDVFNEFAGSPPNGKMRVPDEHGLPAWGDIPAPTQGQLIVQADAHKAALLASAQSAISLWQSELLLGVISDEDKVSLTAWIAYIKAVKAIDTSAAPDNEWPIAPTN